ERLRRDGLEPVDERASEAVDVLLMLGRDWKAEQSREAARDHRRRVRVRHAQHEALARDSGLPLEARGDLLRQRLGHRAEVGGQEKDRASTAVAADRERLRMNPLTDALALVAPCTEPGEPDREVG